MRQVVWEDWTELPIAAEPVGIGNWHCLEGGRLDWVDPGLGNILGHLAEAVVSCPCLHIADEWRQSVAVAVEVVRSAAEEPTVPSSGE